MAQTKDEALESHWVGRWTGRVVVCIASGPSLTAEDCELVRRSGHPTIVTNNSFRLAPWSDVLMAFDGRWWTAYADEVMAFKGERVSCSYVDRCGAQSLAHQSWFRPFGNSGTAAISLAVTGGAARVLMLGYDAQRTNGRTHWHEDHPAPLSNAISIKAWPGKFQMLAAHAEKHRCSVVNCSRESALQCFPRADLEHELSRTATDEGRNPTSRAHRHARFAQEPAA